MEIKQLLGAFSATIIRIVVAVLLIILVYKGAVTAYDFGYNIFADIPVSEEGKGRTVSVVISNGTDTKQIASVLADKGLVQDKNLFYFQELLSDYHGKIQPGTYELSTEMSVEKMLTIMCKMEEATE